MKKGLYLSLLLLVSLCTHSLHTGSTKESEVVVRDSPYKIVLFLGPQLAIPLDAGKVMPPNMTDLEKMLKVLLKNSTEPLISGVYVTSYGFVGTLDENGEVILQRKNTEEELTLIITKGLRPIILQGETVEQFKRKKTSEAAYYSIKRICEVAHTCYWEVTQLPLPLNRIIPPQAIVIYAKPKDIFVPEGVFTAVPGPHLILPPIYPTRRINRDLNALSFLKINRYFKPIVKANRYLKDRYATMIS